MITGGFSCCSNNFTLSGSSHWSLTLAPVPVLRHLNMETHMESDFSIRLDNISKIQTVSQRQKRQIWAGSVNSAVWNSFPWSVTVPSLTLLYIKPAGCDNLLGDRGARKPALLRVSPENVFLQLEGLESCIMTSVSDCRIFTRCDALVQNSRDADTH